MTQNKPAGFHEKAERLQKELAPKTKSPEPSFKGMAWSASCDMLAAIVVAFGLGVVLEHFYPAFAPWGMILGFLLGSITGLRNVYRRLVKMGYGLGWSAAVKDDQGKS